MNKVSVYKDRSVGSWRWACHVPFCDRQEWTTGGHPRCVKASLAHLSSHSRTGFGRK
jgi:hypothetical protein